MHEIHLRILRMERPAMNAATTGTAHYNRNASAPPITAFRREIRDLIESTRDEIRELHFCHGPHTHQGSADRGSHNSRLGDRSINDAPLTKSFQHPGSDFECASVDAHVLAKDEYTLVFLHF